MSVKSIAEIQLDIFEEILHAAERFYEKAGRLLFERRHV